MAYCGKIPTAYQIEQCESQCSFPQAAKLLFDNWYRLLPLLASKGLDTDTPGAWYLFMAQVTIGAVFAGMFAAPAGLLGVKVFARRHDVA